MKIAASIPDAMAGKEITVSDTPETDAVYTSGWFGEYDFEQLLELARDLERRLADANAEIAALKQRLVEAQIRIDFLEDIRGTE